MTSFQTVLIVTILSGLACSGRSAAETMAAPRATVSGDASSASAPSAAAESDVRAISLQEAVTLAQQNAPEIVAARGRTQANEAAVRAAYASFIPGVSLSAGASRQYPSEGTSSDGGSDQAAGTDGRVWSFSAGVSADVTLFDGGRRFLELGQANARLRAAGTTETAQRFSVALAAKESFFNVLAARETEAAALAQLAQAEQQFRDSVARLQAKTATRSDSLRSDIQLRNARLAVLEAGNSIAASNASLTRVVGTPYRVTASEADSVASGDITLSEAALVAIATDAPQVRQAEQSLAVARAARLSAWTAYLPRVTAGYSRGASDGSSSFDPLGGGYSYSGSLRLSVSLPLFDQLQRETQITEAEVAERDAAATLRDARLAVTEGLTQSLGSFRSAGERVSSLVATVAAAEEDLRVQQQRYAVGASTLLDILTSMTQLDSARRDLIRAKYDRRIARAQIEEIVGQQL